jgi:spore maturation protein CgeB
VKILLYGEVREDSTANLLNQALLGLGHTVEVFDPAAFLFTSRGHKLSNRILDRLLAPTVVRRINTAFLARAGQARPDVVLVIKGFHLTAETVSQIRQRLAPVLNWNPDDFFNPANSSDSLLSAYREYDCILTPRGHLLDEYRSRGARRVEELEVYYAPTIHRPMPLDSSERAAWGADMAFIGTWSKDREDLLLSLDGLDVRIWGKYWQRASCRFRAAFRVEQRSADLSDMARVVNATRININILRRENRDETNLKVFEILGCGGFLLTNRSRGVKALFRENSEIACYETPEELRQRCEYFLREEAERRAIAEAGLTAVTTRGHTTSDRARQLMAVVESIRRPT